MAVDFTLFLFSTDPAFVQSAVAAGVGGIVVDWEWIGKEARQAQADTQINRDTVDDLRRIRACTEALVVCRINSYGTTTEAEVEQAIEAGADEILIPMVRTASEVEAVLDLVRGRCGVGILVETIPAVQLASALGRLPVTRVYVGLNDLAIDRGTPCIFTALADGTLEGIREHFKVPFGFGGLTLPDRGSPIQCRLLIAEMARLGCHFSFLRRSFLADIKGRDMAVEVQRIHTALLSARQRSPEVVAQDRAALRAIVESLSMPEGARR